MCSSSGLYFAIGAFLITICVEQLAAINPKIDSLNKISKIKSYRLKSDSRLTTDLDRTFNTFKRKDHIGQKVRKSKEIAGKRKANEVRSVVKQSAKTQPQFSHTRNATSDSTKRQYIYGSPSVISGANSIPRRFVAYPSPGLRTG